MRKYVLPFLCVLLLGLFHFWPRDPPVAPDPPPRTRNLTVLLWHWPFGHSQSLDGDVCWDSYRIPGCRLADRRSLFSSADVVVFHNRELIQDREKLPLDLPRPRSQRWAWMSLEAPVHNGDLRRFANVFNLTVSYRRDADITVPYGKLVPREPEGVVVEEEEEPLNKSSLVCWVVSNYQRHHRRSRVYAQLKARVPVTVYGRWTGKILSEEELLPTISRCYFYLAFENANAKDYITEKLWRNAYESGAVPVVLGPPAGDYSAVAPPDSFIHEDRFASGRELGTFLERLAEDEQRYRGYLRWRRDWRVKLFTDWRERLCHICLHHHTLPAHKVYTDLMTWMTSHN